MCWQYLLKRHRNWQSNNENFHKHCENFAHIMKTNILILKYYTVFVCCHIFYLFHHGINKFCFTIPYFVLFVCLLPALMISGINPSTFPVSVSLRNENGQWVIVQSCAIRHRSGYVTPCWLDHAPFIDDEGHRICMVITLVVIEDTKAWSGWHGDNPITRNTLTANRQNNPPISLLKGNDRFLFTNNILVTQVSLMYSTPYMYCCLEVKWLNDFIVQCTRPSIFSSEQCTNHKGWVHCDVKKSKDGVNDKINALVLWFCSHHNALTLRGSCIAQMKISKDVCIDICYLHYKNRSVT